MADTTTTPQEIFKKEFFLLRWLKGVALLRESGVGMFGAFLVLFWIFVAIFAPLLSPFDPLETLAPLQLPGAEFIVEGTKIIGSQGVAADLCTMIESGEQAGMYHCGTFLLGTDLLGRDILSRIIWGSRQVLVYAPLATFCAYAVGIPMGLLAGYKRGRADDILSFIANVILSFPVLVLYIIVILLIGSSGLNIIIAVTFASAPGIMRIVRGLTLDLRNREYVFAAETRGEPLSRILFVEILPNARGPLIVDSMLRLGYTIITIGVLGFLGMGLPPPAPGWGAMISEFRGMIQTFPHMAVFPCFAISSLVLGFNLLADGLREVSLRD